MLFFFFFLKKNLISNGIQFVSGINVVKMI